MPLSKAWFERLRVTPFPNDYKVAVETLAEASVTAVEGWLLSICAEKDTSSSVKKKKLEGAFASLKEMSATLQAPLRKCLCPAVHAHAMALTMRP